MREISGPGLWRLRIFDEVGSTQDVALAAARAGEPGPWAILARRQSSGRGRAGRGWTAPEGNLNFSAVLRPAGAPAAGWSLLAGVAVFEAAAGFVPGAALMLKWPNDLLLNGGKLGGVLIDTTLRADGSMEWVVIGVGVNLASAPRVEGRRTACLADAGAAVAPEDFAARLMAAIDRWRAAEFAVVRQAWLARAHPVGTRLRVQRGGDVIEGAFLGLTEDGRLRLENAGDTASGDVFIVGAPG
jgi:BirA family biotin operon repressor/biotin-[acetyl-CoA-carboxylase] ligase